MEAHKVLQLAREAKRPSGQAFIDNLLTDFIELHGDRRYGDDAAIVGGIGRLCGRPITVLANEKGSDLTDKARRNFGSAHPEGYRKALRLMKQAEKFNRPVLCLIDTSGAFCGIGAEERGQGQAIAENLMEMMTLKVPVVSIILGEGGSGGALALAVANQVWMMEHSVYSVISPEGCSSILWKTSARVKEAAQCLKITPSDLHSMGIIERIIPELPKSRNVYSELKQVLDSTFTELTSMTEQQLCQQRYERFRNFGVFSEVI